MEIQPGAESQDLADGAIRIRLGEVVNLDDSHLSSETGVLGLWQPYEYTKQHGFGVDFLASFDPSRVAVLFIDGAAGSPQDSALSSRVSIKTSINRGFWFIPQGSPLSRVVYSPDRTLGGTEGSGVF